jgi:uncharacterized protein (DUF488 family)
MGNEVRGVIGVGYEGEDLDKFVEGLTKWDVFTLVDVRLNPISRKRGFSKTALQTALQAAGIQYRHEPTLGNPKDNREGYAEIDSEYGNKARARFIALLSDDAASAALDSIAEVAVSHRVAVMCFEASERKCHRRQVLDELRGRLSSLISA